MRDYVPVRKLLGRTGELLVFASVAFHFSIVSSLCHSERSEESRIHSSLDWQLRVFPFEHTAFKVPDVLEAQAGEDCGGGGASDSDSAYRDDVASLRVRYLFCSLGQLLQRYQPRARDMAQLSAILIFLAYVDEHGRIGIGEPIAQLHGAQQSHL